MSLMKCFIALGRPLRLHAWQWHGPFFAAPSETTSGGGTCMTMMRGRRLLGGGGLVSGNAAFGMANGYRVVLVTA
jgi:hypothetical protein